MNEPDFEDPIMFQYAAHLEGALMIAAALNRLTFLERMKPIMAEVAKELLRRGVDFSKAK